MTPERLARKRAAQAADSARDVADVVARVRRVAQRTASLALSSPAYLADLRALLLCADYYEAAHVEPVDAIKQV